MKIVQLFFPHTLNLNYLQFTWNCTLVNEAVRIAFSFAPFLEASWFLSSVQGTTARLISSRHLANKSLFLQQVKYKQKSWIYFHVFWKYSKRAAKTPESCGAAKVTAHLWSKLWILIEFVCRHILCLCCGVEIVNKLLFQKFPWHHQLAQRLLCDYVEYLILNLELGLWICARLTTNLMFLCVVILFLQMIWMT